jgi:hypothetical protein
MPQHAPGVDEILPLLTLDLLARIGAMRVVPPPFSALFALRLSVMAPLGQASRSACSRQAT